MFCNQCGTKIEEGMSFCTNCGAKVVVEQPVDTEQTVPPTGYAYQPAQEVYVAQESTQDNASYTQGALSSPANVGFGEAIKLFFANYTNFRGRSTKSEYWWAFLFNFFVSMLTTRIPIIGGLISLALLIPGLSLGVRRLHDTGKKWTYMFIGLIPLVGGILLIIQYCKGSDGDNQWGPAPVK